MAAILEVEMIIEAPAWRDKVAGVESLCRRAAEAAFTAGFHHDRLAEASVVLTDDGAASLLNQRYRGGSGATNVLSFANLSEGDLADPPAGGPPLMLGDIVIALETTEAEALAQEKTLADHLSHLVVHGMLHLLGWDHRTEAEAATMEGLEVRILAGLGVADPYRPIDDALA